MLNLESWVLTKMEKLGNCDFQKFRYVVLLMLFLVTFTSFVLRVNMNIAIVTMNDTPSTLCSNSTSK